MQVSRQNSNLESKLFTKYLKGSLSILYMGELTLKKWEISIFNPTACLPCKPIFLFQFLTLNFVKCGKIMGKECQCSTVGHMLGNVKNLWKVLPLKNKFVEGAVAEYRKVRGKDG